MPETRRVHIVSSRLDLAEVVVSVLKNIITTIIVFLMIISLGLIVGPTAAAGILGIQANDLKFDRILLTVVIGTLLFCVAVVYEVVRRSSGEQE